MAISSNVALCMPRSPTISIVASRIRSRVVVMLLDLFVGDAGRAQQRGLVGKIAIQGGAADIGRRGDLADGDVPDFILLVQ